MTKQNYRGSSTDKGVTACFGRGVGVLETPKTPTKIQENTMERIKRFWKKHYRLGLGISVMPLWWQWGNRSYSRQNRMWAIGPIRLAWRWGYED